MTLARGAATDEHAPVRPLLLALIALAACGDNDLPTGEPLAQSRDLVIVAHEDDDLLFMQPDITEAVRSGNGVTTVYVTAGNGTGGTKNADRRYRALRYAYETAANQPYDAWQCGWITIADHVAQHCRLEAANVSLVFLAYPDGGIEGQYAHSLLKLWEGDITSADTVADRKANYDQAGLISVLSEIMTTTAPTTIHTLEVAGTHGYDHTDHMIVGALAVLAASATSSQADLISYRGYNITDDAADKIEPIYDYVFPVLSHYEACAADCAACGSMCTTIDTTHIAWMHRRYAIGFRRGATGQLATGGMCASATQDGGILMGDCATAPVWTFVPGGALQVDTRCLEALPTGELIAGTCHGGPEQNFRLDDEGHIWVGIPPYPQTGMDYAHLDCLGTGGGHAHAVLCGQDGAPTWSISPIAHATPRAGLGVAATGRSVRIGDLTGDGKADLCAIDNGALRCAPGDGTGGFAAAVRIDATISPLAIDPDSLVLGDVDGDGLIDACGRDTMGLLCATAASGFAATRWSSAFADSDAQGSTSASLAIVTSAGAPAICGLATEGEVCATQTAMTVQSVWPMAAAIGFPAELDDDGNADWCAVTSTGVSCNVAAETGVTTDGEPWGFSVAGTPDPAPTDAVTSAVADIDGDGRADLCSIVAGGVSCARSSGRGFGPLAATLAVFPAGTTATALWLGDLDGDGAADACVDAGTDILCVVGR